MEFSRVIKRKLTEADWFLIIGNLVPVYGAWFRNWDGKEIFLVYCLETVIIGLFTLVKLFIATASRKTDWWQNNNSRIKVHGLFFIFFFLLHYGLFVTVQVSVFLGFTSVNSNVNPSLLQLVFHPSLYLDRHAWLMLSVFVFCYGYENLFGFIMNNDYRAKPFMRIMFEPYMRIFVQQLTVLLGGFILAFGAGSTFIFVFVLVKIFFTVFVDYDSLLKKGSQEAFIEN
jgi:hypothetical protein